MWVCVCRGRGTRLLYIRYLFCGFRFDVCCVSLLLFCTLCIFDCCQSGRPSFLGPMCFLVCVYEPNIYIAQNERFSLEILISYAMCYDDKVKPFQTRPSWDQAIGLEVVTVWSSYLYRNKIWAHRPCSLYRGFRFHWTYKKNVSPGYVFRYILKQKWPSHRVYTNREHKSAWCHLFVKIIKRYGVIFSIISWIVDVGHSHDYW